MIDECISLKKEVTHLKRTFLLITFIILLPTVLSRGKHMYHFVMYPYRVGMNPSILPN